MALVDLKAQDGKTLATFQVDPKATSCSELGKKCTASADRALPAEDFYMMVKVPGAAERSLPDRACSLMDGLNVGWVTAARRSVRGGD